MGKYAIVFLIILILFPVLSDSGYAISYNKSNSENILGTSKVHVYITINNKEEEKVYAEVDKEINIDLNWEQETEGNIITVEGIATARLFRKARPIPSLPITLS